MCLAKKVSDSILDHYPVDTGRELDVRKTFRRRPGRLLNVLCTFIVRPGVYRVLYHGTILREKSIDQVLTNEIKMVKIKIVHCMVFLFDYDLSCNNLECFRKFDCPYLLPNKMEYFPED